MPIRDFENTNLSHEVSVQNEVEILSDLCIDQNLMRHKQEILAV